MRRDAAGLATGGADDAGAAAAARRPGRRSTATGRIERAARRRGSVDVMRRPPGLREIDRPGEEGLPEDDAARRRYRAGGAGRRGRGPPGHQDLGIVRPNERAHPLEVRLGAAVAEHEPRDAGPDQLADSSSTVGGAARCQGNAASRSGRGSRPTASQSPATARQARRSSGRSAMAVVSTTRVAPAANASRIASAESTPPATWSGTATRAAIEPIGLELGRGAGSGRPRSRRGG